MRGEVRVVGLLLAGDAAGFCGDQVVLLSDIFVRVLHRTMCWILPLSEDQYVMGDGGED